MSRIIVVDDKEQDRYLLQVLLQRSDYLVETATNGAEALALARKSPPDMLVSDILMPVMDGFTLCREWRKDAALASLPFVFYTATYTDPRDEEFALKLGADRFIVKPVDPAALLDLFKEVLSGVPKRRFGEIDPSSTETDSFFKTYSEVLVRKLEDKAERFRAMIDIDPSAVFLLSPSCSILEINRSAVNLLGGRVEETLDKSFTDCFVPVLNRAAFLEQMQAALSGSTLRNFESNLQLIDGSERTLSWNARRLVRASGALEGVLLIGNDITARKQAEMRRIELETLLRHAQKMEAIGAFAGGIAHDFNNILTGIIGYIDMTRSEVATGTSAEKNLQHAMLATDRARDLVRQILAISRRSEEKFKPIEIAPIVEEAGKLLRASIPQSIDISLSIDKACGSIMGDPTQIHQILMNLCTNAYHAVGDAEGCIKISCNILREPVEISVSDPVLQPGKYIVVTVSDTGTGMNTATLERIFDPYFTTKEEGKGTGLGLPIAKAIVHNHGGHLLVESAPGKGSIFRVFLPRFESKVSPTEPTTSRAWETGKKQAILLVEDNEMLGPMLMRALTDLGYRPSLASNGLQACEMFERNPRSYDVVLTDLTMPKMGGLEMAKRLHEAQPSLPIILMSGHAERPADYYLGHRGIKAFIQKPFSIGELSRSLKEIFAAGTA